MYLSEEADAPRKPNALWRLWQWLVAGAFGLIALMAVMPVKPITTPGVPLTAYWSAVAVVAVVAAIASPPVFFRLPKLAKWLSYGSLFGAFVFFGAALGGIQEAYERTPAGMKEKAAAHGP